MPTSISTATASAASTCTLQQFFPIFDKKRVFAVQARVITSAESDGQTVPFYLQPTLGGSTTLRSVSDYRFRDDNVLHLNAEYRWEAFNGLDMALFARLRQGHGQTRRSRPDGSEHGYGVGLRFNTYKTVLLRLDVGPAPAKASATSSSSARRTDFMRISQASERRRCWRPRCGARRRRAAQPGQRSIPTTRSGAIRKRRTPPVCGRSISAAATTCSRTRSSAPANASAAPPMNVNTLDEVPDSTWFTNRLGRRPVSIADSSRARTAARGRRAGPWTIVSGKTEGVQPGLTVRDAAGAVYFVKFDPPSNPEMATGAEIVATKFLHAAGYHVPENYLATIRPRGAGDRRVGAGRGRRAQAGDAAVRRRQRPPELGTECRRQLPGAGEQGDRRHAPSGHSAITARARTTRTTSSRTSIAASCAA